MAWKIEKLAGTINGSNRNFTLSNAPNAASLLIFFTGIPLEVVGSQPQQMQLAYAGSGVNIELGLAPTSEGQRPWARYWHG